MPGVIIDKGYCKGCELCVKACPQQILSMSKEITNRGYLSRKCMILHDALAAKFVACLPDAAITVVTHGQRYVLYEY